MSMQIMRGHHASIWGLGTLNPKIVPVQELRGHRVSILLCFMGMGGSYNEDCNLLPLCTRAGLGAAESLNLVGV